ncbi:MAG: PAS domain-containing protein [Anaerolineae bacterium]|nr:PAS domain-containing protein [Anaerolineae bacterium]
MWPYTVPAIIFMSFTTAISAVVTILVWQRRATSGALYLAVPLATATCWSLGYTFELASSELSQLVFWNKVQYIFIHSTLVAWAAFVLYYTGRERWVRSGWFVFLAVIPLLTIVFAWTNPLHKLLWVDVQLNPQGAVPNTISVRGPWYWVAVGYSYVLLLVGTILLAQMFFRSPDLYRRQAGTLLVALLAPWVANALYIANLDPIPGLELTPFAFTVTNVAFAWSLFRYHLLDIMPVARATLIERLSDLVIVLDDQCRVVDLNPAASQVLGCTASEAVGVPIADLWTGWPELVQDSSATEEVRKEIRLVCDRDAAYFDLHLSPLRDRRGRLTGRLLVLHDITERVQAAEQRERLIVELDAFAHTVAHDLKNPLSTLVGYSELLVARFDRTPQDKALGFLDLISRTGRRMSRIIDELLLMATMRQTDAVELDRLEDMVSIVLEAQERIDNLVQEYQAEIALPEAWPVALGYGPWVEEVWANYLSNAIKYGGQPPRIEIGATILDGGDRIQFWVRDNGPGLTEQEQARLFTMFSRLNPVQAKGYGLGLSIVKRIVEKLGGDVGVESRVGEGSTFSFILPAATEASDAGREGV